jgi:hypothetical protein
MWSLAAQQENPMGLKVTIDNAKSIDTGVWKANLNPDEAATFGDCTSNVGPYTVVYLEAIVDFNERSQCLTFDPASVRVLNLGTSDEIIILGQQSSQPESTVDHEGPSATAAPSRPKSETPPPLPEESFEADAVQKPDYELSQALSTGDKLFISELPPELRRLGEQFLSEIRDHFQGELTYEPRFAKFDETPEIFWTVKILAQEKALRVTVRGTPDDFTDMRGLDVKLDKFGYSKFNLVSTGQIPEALECIRRAAQILLAS